MFYIASLFWLFSISGLLTILFKKKFEIVTPISMIIGTFLLYAFGFINKISYGYYLSWVFVAAFWIIIVYWLIKKRDKLKEFISNYFTIGFIVFLIVFVYICLLYRLQGYSYCDEFTHWGPMVIATLKTNGFYAQPQEWLNFHQDYPPFFTLLEVLFCGFNKFAYHEQTVYTALHLFMMSCFLPLFSKFDIKNKKDYLKAFICLICIILIGLTISKTSTASDYAYVYSSIYVDWALGLFTAYSLFMVFKENEWKVFGYFFLTIYLSALLIMKQMGICLYLLVLFYAFIKLTYIDKKMTVKRLIVGIITFVAIPMCFYLSWKHIINIYDLTGQFVISDFKFKDVINIIKGNTEYEWKTVAFYNFKEALLNRKLILHPYGTTYPLMAIILTATICLLYRNMNGYFIGGTYLLGAIGYALAMMLLYILAFDSYEAPALASFDRYMLTYIFAGNSLTMLVCLDKLDEKIYKYLVTLGIICLFVDFDSISNVIPKTTVSEDNTMNVLVVQQFGDQEYHRENLNGIKMNFDIIEFAESPGSGSTRSQYFTVDEWKEKLLEYDLMYIDGYDDIFYKTYWEPLEQDDDFYLFNGWLYSIKDDNGKIVLGYEDRTFMYYVLRYYKMNY